jgi:hypothetical protein
MTWMGRLKDALKIPVSQKEKLKKIICERAIDDFLGENPDFEVRGHSYPFHAYTMVDLRPIAQGRDEMVYGIYLHGIYEPEVMNEMFQRMKDRGCRVCRQDFNYDYPRIINPFERRGDRKFFD